MQVVGRFSRYINTVEKTKRRPKTARKDNGFTASRTTSDTRMLDDLELIDAFGVGILILLVASVAVIIVSAPDVANTPEAPDSDWSLERVNSTHVVVHHQRGEPVAKDNLTVIVDEYPRTAKWSGNASGRYVREGSSAVFEVGEGQDVAVYWTGVDTVRREVLVQSNTET